MNPYLTAQTRASLVRGAGGARSSLPFQSRPRKWGEGQWLAFIRRRAYASKSNRLWLAASPGLRAQGQASSLDSCGQAHWEQATEPSFQTLLSLQLSTVTTQSRQVSCSPLRRRAAPRQDPQEAAKRKQLLRPEFPSSLHQGALCFTATLAGASAIKLTLTLTLATWVCSWMVKTTDDD